MGQAKYYAEFTYGTGTDKNTYRVYKDKLGYEQAKTYATSLTGDATKSYLVSTATSGENDAVYNKTTEYITPGAYPNNYVWMGGNYDGANWKYYYNGATVDDGGANYNNWNQLGYAEWAAAADPAQKYMAMGLQYDTVTGKEWYPKTDTPSYYVTETAFGYDPNYRDINTIGYGSSKEIITDYTPSNYDAGLRINARELTNFDHYTDWNFKSFNNKKKFKKASKQDYDFVYYKKTGDLYYNENGDSKGWGLGGDFAQLENRYRLTESQISVYDFLGHSA
jgi:hypothetical protein